MRAKKTSNRTRAGLTTEALPQRLYIGLERGRQSHRLGQAPETSPIKEVRVDIGWRAGNLCPRRGSEIDPVENGLLGRCPRMFGLHVNPILQGAGTRVEKAGRHRVKSKFHAARLDRAHRRS